MKPHDKWTSRDIAEHTYSSGPWKNKPRRRIEGNGNIRAGLGGIVVAFILLAFTGWLG